MLEKKRSIITKQNIKKVMDIMAQDARYTVQDVASMVGISVGSVYFP